MTVFGKLVLVSFISTFAMFGALSSENPVPMLIVAMLAWFLFIRSLIPSKKN